MIDRSGKAWCLSCAEADCVVKLSTAQGPDFRCLHCGPVVRLQPAHPADDDIPELYARSLEELTKRLAAEFEPPPLDIEHSERRVSPRGCVICSGPITFEYWTDRREVESGAWCDHCGAVELVTSDPLYPKFRPKRRLGMRLVHSRP